MTQIHISIRKPKTGGLDPVTGTLRFRPVRRHFDAAKNLIIAASFDANLSETGELTVDLLPTTPAFVWQVVGCGSRGVWRRLCGPTAPAGSAPSVAAAPAQSGKMRRSASSQCAGVRPGACWGE